MPRDQEGIIQPNPHCRDCPHLRACLRAAIAASGGIKKVKAATTGAEDPEDSKAGGIVAAIHRWSARKLEAERRRRR